VKVEVVDSYKTKPPDALTKKNDVALVTAIVYKFWSSSGRALKAPAKKTAPPRAAGRLCRPNSRAGSSGAPPGAEGARRRRTEC
jgi:hypothetical protein